MNLDCRISFEVSYYYQLRAAPLFHRAYGIDSWLHVLIRDTVYEPVDSHSRIRIQREDRDALALYWYGIKTLGDATLLTALGASILEKFHVRFR